MKKLILLGAPLSIAALAPVAISASCDSKEKIDVKNTKVQKHMLQKLYEYGKEWQKLEPEKTDVPFWSRLGAELINTKAILDNEKPNPQEMNKHLNNCF